MRRTGSASEMVAGEHAGAWLSTQVPSRGSTAGGDDEAITAPLPLLAVLPGADEAEAAGGKPRAYEPPPVQAVLRSPHGSPVERRTFPERWSADPFTPLKRRRRWGSVGEHKVALAAVGVGALLTGALVVNFAGGSDPVPDSTDVSSSPVVATTPKAADQAKLAGLLPPAFNAAKACRASESNPPGVVASVECASKDRRPEVPAAATYRLVDQRATLDTLLEAALERAKVQVCPGNIQSPGGWHRTATPNVTSGTVFCGMSANAAVVGWTDTDNLLFAEIHSAPAQAPTNSGAAMSGLYQWWSMNS